MGYTIKRELTVCGIGIHSGTDVKLILKPSQSGKIQFIIPDLGQRIPVNLRYVKPQNLGTNLVKGCVSINTIEHFMSVLWYFRITDLDIEIHGREIPIGDGSGRYIYEGIHKIGLKRTQTKARILKPKKIVYQEYDKDAFCMLIPSNKFVINYTINFPHNPIKTQNFIFRSRQDYPLEICCNRTFGNINDLEKLHAEGLAMGASMDNVLVYDDERFINKLNNEDEAVRHKILDLIGDLYTSGYFVQGKIIAYKTSHKTNNQFIKNLLKFARD